MPPRPRLIPPAPPAVPPFPAWARSFACQNSEGRLAAPGEGAEEASFLAGASLAGLLELKCDDALENVAAVAAKLAKGQGSAVAAAAAIAAVSQRLRPDSDALALWLADAVLAHRLNWPAPVPLIAGHVRRGDLRAALRHGDGDAVWLTACCGGYARAAAAAADLYAELARRAHRLLAAAPKLRGKDAGEMVAILLMEDAQPAAGGKAASDRSSRRLFDRLVALGAVRELTGRPAFRLYGL